MIKSSRERCAKRQNGIEACDGVVEGATLQKLPRLMLGRRVLRYRAREAPSKLPASYHGIER